MRGIEDTKDARPSGMFRPDATARQKAAAIATLCAVSCGIALALYGRAANRPWASVIGSALFLGPLAAGIVAARLRAGRDPAFAKELAEVRARSAPQQRARQNRLKLRALSAVAVLAALLGLAWLRRLVPGLAQMSHASFAILAQFIGGGAALALGFAWRWIRTSHAGREKI